MSARRRSSTVSRQNRFIGVESDFSPALPSSGRSTPPKASCHRIPSSVTTITLVAFCGTP